MGLHTLLLLMVFHSHNIQIYLNRLIFNFEVVRVVRRVLCLQLCFILKFRGLQGKEFLFLRIMLQ